MIIEGLMVNNSIKF